jgi:hypothetical protein
VVTTQAPRHLGDDLRLVADLGVRDVRYLLPVEELTDAVSFRSASSR